MRTDLSEAEHWYLNYFSSQSREGIYSVAWSPLEGFSSDTQEEAVAVRSLIERGLVAIITDKVRERVWINITPDGVFLARIYGRP